MVDVLEESSALFTFRSFLGLLEHVAGALLGHDHVDPFESTVRRDVLPDIGNAACQGEASTTAGLSQFIYAVVSIVGREGFHARGEMVQLIEQLEVSFLYLLVTLLHDSVYDWLHARNHIHSAHVWPDYLHVCLVIDQFPLLLDSWDSFELSSADGVSCGYEQASKKLETGTLNKEHSGRNHNSVDESRVTF